MRDRPNFIRADGQHEYILFFQMVGSAKYGPDAYEIDFSSAPKRKGISTKISKDIDLVRVLAEGGPNPFQLSTDFVPESLPFAPDARECVAYSPSEDKWRFAAKTEPEISPSHDPPRG